MFLVSEHFSKGEAAFCFEELSQAASEVVTKQGQPTTTYEKQSNEWNPNETTTELTQRKNGDDKKLKTITVHTITFRLLLHLQISVLKTFRQKFGFQSQS